MSLETLGYPKIVFVHLGRAKAPHLWLNLERTQTLFPSSSIHLVIDEQIKVPRRILAFVTIHIYVQSPEVSDLRARHTHAASFRKGFWWLSLERLIALGQAHSAIGGGSIIHLESDVMLMPNFPFALFSQQKLSWCRYNEDKDVASIVFSPSIHETEWLITQIIGRVNSNAAHTDMTVLSEIAKTNVDKVSILPSLGNHKIDLRNLQYSQKSYQLNLVVDDFGSNGIFDGAPLGMWLCGQDPRNHYGFTPFQMRNIIESGDSYIDPSKFEFTYETEAGLRVSSGPDSISVWNLHIHSKNLKLLSNSWEAELQRLLNYKEQRREFSARIFWSLILINLRQHTLIRYFVGAPPIYRVIKPIRDRIFK